MSWQPAAPSATSLIIGRRKREISTSPTRGLTEKVVTQLWGGDSHSRMFAALKAKKSAAWRPFGVVTRMRSPFAR